MNEDTFCFYCQRDYETVKKLARHVTRVHPGSYADRNINIKQWEKEHDENGFEDTV